MPPPDTTIDTALLTAAAEAASARRPTLSNETILSLLSDPEVLAIGMSVSELATVAIVSRMSGKHSIFVVNQVLHNLLPLLPLRLPYHNLSTFHILLTSCVAVVAGRLVSCFTTC